jgi:hypothetical protein
MRAPNEKCAKSPLDTIHRFCQTPVAMSGMENQCSLPRGAPSAGRPPRSRFPITITNRSMFLDFLCE